jgi:hypothetical protein
MYETSLCCTYQSRNEHVNRKYTQQGILDAKTQTSAILDEIDKVIPDFLASPSQLYTAFFFPVYALNKFSHPFHRVDKFFKKTALSKIDIIWASFVRIYIYER